MKMDHSEIDNLLGKGIDLKNRRIYFGHVSDTPDNELDGSSFTWNSVEIIVRSIHILENEAPHKPIELHISSPGGDAYEMLRLIDIIEASPCQFKFFGSGKIMSAATWIMAVCDERYLYRNARVLLHDSPSLEMSTGPAKLTDRKIDQEEDEYLQQRLNKIYADNSRMPEDFFKIIVKRDCYLSAEETIAIGLADKIIEPKKRGNLRRMRIALLNKEVDKSDMTKLVKKLYERVNESKSNHKIEIHIVKDKFDSNVYVEEELKEKPIEQDNAQPVQSTLEING